jgi:diguanylate cyclase (GGDEF)-like protein
MLVETLYTQPTSMAIGALCGIVLGALAAIISNNIWLLTVWVALTMVAVVRIIIAHILPRRQQSNTRTLELIFEIGAFSYANLVGIMAGVAIFIDAPPEAQLLTIANAIAYGVGIGPRNAGRPAIAIGQVMLTLLPPTIALLIFGSPAGHTLAVTLLLTIPAMTAITLNVSKVLRNSFAAAETNARLAEKMQVLARTDVVTGLLNRAGLNHELVEIQARMSENGANGKLGLIWMDLDKFKEVNDALGHQVGDRLLAEVASRIRSNVPEGATVARFGGDEFIIACPLSGHNEANALGETLLAEISAPIRIDDDRLEVGSSMGLAIMPEDGEDIETLMQNADLALYHSKVNGRKQLTFYDPTMSRNLVRRREIESELRQALQRDELSIFFQPIVDLATGRIRAFEALVRWFHPQKGELRPDEFIPVAEETGAIITLGNWITKQAAQAAANWPDDVTIAINLSPLQIKAPGAALGILKALREANLDPTRVEFEITETVLLDHSRNTEQFVKELSAEGVRFALDDFGTGYSSLGYLNKYPFSKIKVDRSFVSGMNAKGDKSEAIIRAVSEMGSRLGMEIVAEGLETAEQVEAVREAGCTLGQGYFFSRAVPDYLATMLIAKEREQHEGKRAFG